LFEVWWRVGAIALSLLIGISRIYLGVHYLSDVLAGFALGGGITLMVIDIFLLRGAWRMMKK
jgi:undecaprenyl-diphosphatase